jgi:hypothetical protein
MGRTKKEELREYEILKLDDGTTEKITYKKTYHRIWKKIKVKDDWATEEHTRYVEAGGGKFKCICKQSFGENHSHYGIIKNKENNTIFNIGVKCKFYFDNKIIFSKEIEKIEIFNEKGELIKIIKEKKEITKKIPTKKTLLKNILSYTKVYNIKLSKKHDLFTIYKEYIRSAKCLGLLNLVVEKKRQFEYYLLKKNVSIDCFKKLGMHTIKDFVDKNFNDRTFYDLELDVEFLKLMKRFNSGIEGKQQSYFLKQSRDFKLYYISSKIEELKTMIKHIQETMVEDKEIENKNNQLNNYLEL